MGMFDYLNCDYPLPVEGAPTTGYQTKNTPAQALDVYTIRADGTLWGQEYDFEDRSDPDAKGIMAFAGCATRVNHRDVFCPMTGEVRFYTSMDGGGWVEFSAYFTNGKLDILNVIEAPGAASG